jgi:hypothetical protein
MDKNDFLRLIKNDIVSGWPTSTVTPMTSGWNPSGKDLFIARFKVGNKRIRVEMSPSFFQDFNSAYPLLCAEGQVAEKSQIGEFRRALDEREWDCSFDDENKIWVVHFT